MTESNKPISPLRRRMIEDMMMRKLSPKTQTHNIRAVRNLTRYLRRSPDTVTVEDLRRYQLHLVDTGISSRSLNAAITGLRFFFEVTLDRSDAMAKMKPVYEPRKLPVVLSAEEVTRLLNAAPGLKAKAALAVAYGTGLRASEVIHLKVGDIDRERRVIRVEQGKEVEVGPRHRPLEFGNIPGPDLIRGRGREFGFGIGTLPVPAAAFFKLLILCQDAIQGTLRTHIFPFIQQSRHNTRRRLIHKTRTQHQGMGLIVLVQAELQGRHRTGSVYSRVLMPVITGSIHP